MKKTPLAFAWVATVLVSLATAVTLFFGRDYFYDGLTAAIERGSTAGVVVSVIIPIIAVIMIIIVWVIVWVQYEKLRTKEFKQVAEEMGFIFYPKGDDMQLRIGVTARLSDFHLFSQGRSRKIRNMLHGVSEQLEVGIFGYQYTTGGGEHSDTVRQSVIYFRSPELNLPQFALRPEYLFDKIGSALGYQDIDFESDRTGVEFSKKYLLQGKDEQKVRELFATEVLGFFEGQDGISTEGGGDQLIFYRRRKRIKPEDVRPFMEEGLEVFRLFASSQPS